MRNKMKSASFFLAIMMLCLGWVMTAWSASMGADRDLSMMSYNIQQMGYPAYITNHFEAERLRALPERIRQMEELPDVIIFQEAFLPSAHQYITEQLREHYPYFTDIGGESCELGWDAPATNCREGLHKSLTHNSGVFILSRWPIEERHSLTFTNVRVSYTFDFMARKGAVYARINKAGKPLHVVGTHLQADHGSHDIRMAQVAEVTQWLDQLSLDKNLPLLMAGDFNVSSREQEELTEMLEYSQAELTLCHGGLHSVSPQSNQYLGVIYGTGKEKTLDYIIKARSFGSLLAKTCLEALDFKTVEPWQAWFVFGGRYSLRDISDHYPVLQHFTY